MGQAKARKMNAQKDFEQFNEVVGGQLHLIARAMRSVLEASTDSYAADCAMYALVGAQVLKRLGFEKAQAVAGEAIWRVGPGDDDVITHAKSSKDQGTSFYFKAVPDQEKRREIFHAWITVGDMHILDFTTFSLHHKAKLLDGADGMHTQVDWCPDFLLSKLSDCISVGEVAQSYDVGVYGYVRNPSIEEVIFDGKLNDEAVEENVDSVLRVLELLKDGANVRVMVLDAEQGRIFSAEDNIAKDLEVGLKEFK